MPGSMSQAWSGISGRCGASSRSTSAPCAASVRVATGPAITRVRSSTRSLGRAGRGGGSEVAPLDERWGRPGAARHCASVRTAAPTPPAACSAVSSSTASRCAIAAGASSSRASEHAQRGLAVPGVVGVQPQPPVGGAVERRERVERAASRPTVAAHVPLAAHRDGELAGVDGDGRPVVERGGEQARADGRGGRVRDRERRGQRRAGAGDLQTRELAGIAAERGPHRVEHVPDATVARVRLTHFRELMEGEFGAVRAASLSRDHVFAQLGGRTVEEALEAGIDPREVWRRCARSTTCRPRAADTRARVRVRRVGASDRTGVRYALSTSRVAVHRFRSPARTVGGGPYRRRQFPDTARHTARGGDPAMTAPDREKALQLALAQIEKNHGKGSVMRLGDDTRAADRRHPHRFHRARRRARRRRPAARPRRGGVRAGEQR